MVIKKKKTRKKAVKKLHPFFLKPLLNDGILLEIYEKFFKPVANDVELPEDLNTPYRRLDVALGEGSRWIEEYTLIEDIDKLPGWYFLRDDRAQATTGPRSFKVGTRLLLIYDERDKSEVILELFPSWYDDEGYKFKLTPEEFYSIVHKLEKKNKKLRRY